MESAIGVGWPLSPWTDIDVGDNRRHFLRRTPPESQTKCRPSTPADAKGNSQPRHVFSAAVTGCVTRRAGTFRSIRRCDERSGINVRALDGNRTKFPATEARCHIPRISPVNLQRRQSERIVAP